MNSISRVDKVRTVPISSTSGHGGERSTNQKGKDDLIRVVIRLHELSLALFLPSFTISSCYCNSRTL